MASSSIIQQMKHIWVIAGPAGCGKSTVAIHLARELNLPFLEGDDYHTPDNKAKMESGVALTDEDRWDWLTRLRQEAISKIDAGASGVALACSALKKIYRDELRVAGQSRSDIDVHFVYLHANEDLLIERVKQRQGHYMKEGMVHGQLKTLEKPDGDEERDCLLVDVSAPSEEAQANALQAVKGAIAREAAITHAETSS